MSDAGAVPGWYPDPFEHAEVRWFDGERWSSYVVSGGVESVDHVTDPATPRYEEPVSVGAMAPAAAVSGLATAASAVGASSGQVVIGPTLPTFAALGRSTGPRSLVTLLHRPAVLMAVTTVLAVAPAMGTDTHGADTLASIRLGAGLLAAAGAALLPRLSGNGAKVAKLLPFVFVALQIVAMATTFSAFSAGDSGIGAALPHLIGGVMTLFSVARLVWSQRQVSPHAASPAPAA